MLKKILITIVLIVLIPSIIVGGFLFWDLSILPKIDETEHKEYAEKYFSDYLNKKYPEENFTIINVSCSQNFGILSYDGTDPVVIIAFKDSEGNINLFIYARSLAKSLGFCL